MDPDPTPDLTSSDFKNAEKKIFFLSIFFSYNITTGTLSAV
jgi:hypothetical protein